MPQAVSNKAHDPEVLKKIAIFITLEIGGSKAHLQGISIIPILSRRNPTSHIVTSIKSILTLSCHLSLGLPRGLLLTFWNHSHLLQIWLHTLLTSIF